MTLEEAIEHAKSQAIKLGCTECGKEHEQLAEWLKELKEYKKQVFKLGDIVYWYDDDYRYFESAIKNISICLTELMNTLHRILILSQKIQGTGYLKMNFFEMNIFKYNSQY